MIAEKINPAMLVLARESKGITQSELAKLISVSQANVSKFESGMLEVSSEQLGKIAHVLEKPESFFFQPTPQHGFASNCLYHRKRQSVSVRDLRRIIATLKVYRLEVANLLRSVEVEAENRFHRMDIDDYDGPELIASLVRRSWSIPTGPIDNLTRAVENAGGIVIKCSFKTTKVDAMSQWAADMPPLFFINSEIPGDRLRWSLAHEIGHVIMHQIPTNDIEGEANKFASELLMPKAEIAPELNNISIPKLARLKPYWKVSMAALLMRAGQLKKITQRQKEYLWTQMGSHGYRRREPVDIPIEEPVTIHKIVNAHITELGYSAPDLSNLVHSLEDHFRSKYLQEKTTRLRIVS